MKTFQIKLGLRSDMVQSCLINYAFLRSAGVTLDEFMGTMPTVDSLFGAVISKPDNQLSMACQVFDDMSSDEARQQIVRLVHIQLAVLGISTGEFATAVHKYFRPVEAK